MTDPRLYEQDAFVFLESGKPEELLSVAELRKRLTHVMAMNPDDIPTDVATKETVEQQVQYLLDNYCELSLGGSQLIQWFAVRLERE